MIIYKVSVMNATRSNITANFQYYPSTIETNHLYSVLKSLFVDFKCFRIYFAEILLPLYYEKKEIEI